MSQPVRILGADGQPLKLDRPSSNRRPMTALELAARYDAAETRDGNYRHWQNADHLSARAANDPDTRARLRSRSRYECANNGYFQGLVESLAHDAIGTGPRLQLTLMDRSPDQARWVERAWSDWANDEVVDFPDKLRIAKESEVRDGEHFGILVNNPGVSHPVKLDVVLVEAEQCADPVPPFGQRQAVDGIRFDQFGNPNEYHFLEDHPGDEFFRPLAKVNAVPAEFVIHWFRAGRAGQRRGVPQLTPALPVGAILRRYCLATLEAAEFAANIAGVMTNTGVPGAGEDVQVEAYDKFPVERGYLLSLPDGRDAKAFDPAQPTTTYRDFKGENLDEIGRAVHAPSNVVRGNSREYNFSSGRLDYVIYHRAVRIDRRRKERKSVNRVFRAWAEEAIRIPGVLPPNLPPISEWQWSWYWDGFESINPVDDATAEEKQLKNGRTTYAELFAQDGKDYEEVFAQQAREMKMREDLGLPPPPWAQPAQPAGAFGGGA